MLGGRFVWIRAAGVGRGMKKRSPLRGRPRSRSLQWYGARPCSQSRNPDPRDKRIEIVDPRLTDALETTGQPLRPPAGSRPVPGVPVVAQDVSKVDEAIQTARAGRRADSNVVSRTATGSFETPRMYRSLTDSRLRVEGPDPKTCSPPVRTSGLAFRQEAIKAFGRKSNSRPSSGTVHPPAEKPPTWRSLWSSRSRRCLTANAQGYHERQKPDAQGIKLRKLLSWLRPMAYARRRRRAKK